MPFTIETLLERLTGLERVAGEPARYVVGYSGGLDSTVLLHALARSAPEHGRPIVAVHVDHQLHPDSRGWETHCRTAAAALDVEFASRQVVVDRDSAAGGMEAAARVARYSVFHALLRPRDWLLSAHHENDQAETLLLNLLRGSGVAGLAGIGESQEFARGHLLRPLLGVSVDELRDYATAYELDWIRDPSNDDVRFDRNFLRHEIMPLLSRRWPAAASKIRQSAELAGEASELLGDLAELDLRRLGGPARMSVDALAKLPETRQRNALRHALRQLGLPPIPARRLRQVFTDLLRARRDAEPLIAWQGGELRRFRGQLYVLAPAPDDQENTLPTLCSERPVVDLGAGRGRLCLVQGDTSGINPDLVSAGLEVRYRDGGEAIRPLGQTHTRKLKKLLQDEVIVPWMRSRIPLLYAGDALVAVADLWIAETHSASPGFLVRWEDPPALR